MCDFEDPQEAELLMFVSKVFQYFDNKDILDKDDAEVGCDGDTFLIVVEGYTETKEDGIYWQKLLKENIYQEKFRKPKNFVLREEIRKILDEIVYSLASVGSFNHRWTFFNYIVNSLPLYAKHSAIFLDHGFDPEWLANEKRACLDFFSIKIEGFDDNQVTRDFILKWYAKEVRKVYNTHMEEIANFFKDAEPKRAGCTSILTYLGLETNVLF